jgi:hypothetical protein
MQSRTIRAGDHWKKTATEIHEIVSSLERQHNLAPETSIATGKMIEVAAPYFLVEMLEIQAPVYFQMEMSIFVSQGELGFITSDCPCVWFNPKLHQLPPFYRSPGLMQKDIEVTLPLTPHHLLFISHQKHPFYIDVPQRVVDEANRLRRAYCSDEFVSWKGETRPYWFETGEPPADAWEKTEAGKKALKEQAEWEQELREWELKKNGENQ